MTTTKQSLGRVTISFAWLIIDSAVHFKIPVCSDALRYLVLDSHWEGTWDALREIQGLMKLQISFTNHAFNVQLLLPINFTLAWN